MDSVHVNLPHRQPLHSLAEVANKGTHTKITAALQSIEQEGCVKGHGPSTWDGEPNWHNITSQWRVVPPILVGSRCWSLSHLVRKSTSFCGDNWNDLYMLKFKLLKPVLSHHIPVSWTIIIAKSYKCVYIYIYKHLVSSHYITNITNLTNINYRDTMAYLPLVP